MDFGQLPSVLLSWFCSRNKRTCCGWEEKKNKQKLCTVHHLVKDKKLLAKLNTAQCSNKMKVRGDIEIPLKNDSAKMNIRLKSVEKFIQYNVIYSKPLKFIRFDSKMSFDRIDWKSLRPCNNFLRRAIAVGLCKVNYQIKGSKIFSEIYKENNSNQKHFFNEWYNLGFFSGLAVTKKYEIVNWIIASCLQVVDFIQFSGVCNCL